MKCGSPQFQTGFSSVFNEPWRVQDVLLVQTQELRIIDLIMPTPALMMWCALPPTHTQETLSWGCQKTSHSPEDVSCISAAVFRAQRFWQVPLLLFLSPHHLCSGSQLILIHTSFKCPSGFWSVWGSDEKIPELQTSQCLFCGLQGQPETKCLLTSRIKENCLTLKQSPLMLLEAAADWMCNCGGDVLCTGPVPLHKSGF